MVALAAREERHELSQLHHCVPFRPDCMCIISDTCPIITADDIVPTRKQSIYVTRS